MAIYYVRNGSGLDTNDGLTPSTAWKTIGKANSVAVSGDVIYVGSGGYNWAGADSSSANFPFPTAGHIQYIGDRTGQITGDPAGDIYVNHAHLNHSGITLQGLTISGSVASEGSLYVNDSPASFVEPFYFQQCKIQKGLWIDSHKGNIFNVLNNVINGFTGYDALKFVIQANFAAQLRAYHNTIYGSSASSTASCFTFYKNNDAYANPTIKVKNNIAKQGIGVPIGTIWNLHQNLSGVVESDFNFFDYNGSNFANSTWSGPEDQTLAAWQTNQNKDKNSLEGNPLFQSGSDYKIKFISACRDKGASGLGITTDFDGNSRPQVYGFDIGAYESPNAGSIIIYGQDPAPGQTGVPANQGQLFNVSGQYAIDPLTFYLYANGVGSFLSGQLQSGFEGFISNYGDFYRVLSHRLEDFGWGDTVSISGEISDVIGSGATFNWLYYIDSTYPDFVLQIPAGTSQRLDIYSGKPAWISKMTFEVLDKDGVFTRLLTENRQWDTATNTLLSGTFADVITLYAGFAGMIESDFEPIFIGNWKRVHTNEGSTSYVLETFDMEKFLQKEIFRYTGRHTAGETIFIAETSGHYYTISGEIEVSYSPDDPLQLVPIYSAPVGSTPEQNPESVYGSNYDGKEWRPYYVGIGYMNPISGTLKFDPNNRKPEDEQPDTGTGYNPIDLMLSIILTSKDGNNHDSTRTSIRYDWGYGRSDNLGYYYGCGLPVQYVDIEEFERIRDTYFHDCYALSFQIKERVQGLDFIVNEICRPFDLFLTIKKGRLSLGINLPPEVGDDTVLPEFTDGSDQSFQLTMSGNILEVPTWEIDSSNIYNSVRFSYDWDLFDTAGKHLKAKVDLDINSQRVYDRAQEFKVDSKGIKSRLNGELWVNKKLRNFRIQNKDIHPVVSVPTDFSLITTSVGDIVYLTSKFIPNYTSNKITNQKGIYKAVYRILEKRVDWRNARISWVLRDETFSVYNYRLIAPDSMPNWTQANSTQRKKYLFFTNSSNKYSDGSEDLTQKSFLRRV